MKQFNDKVFRNMIEECNKIKITDYDNYNKYAEKSRENKSELVDYLTTNLTEKKYAYYIYGHSKYNPTDISDLLSESYNELEFEYANYKLITFTDWLDRFNKGTLNQFDINKIYEVFEGNNESGSLFTYIHICKEDNLSKRIEETKKLLYDFAINNKEDFDMPINDEIISNESLCHFYLKIGIYYLYAINLDGPFETYQYVTRNGRLL
jgi:hypothetical protein